MFGAPSAAVRGGQQQASATIVHQGNLMKYTEGAFRDWAYQLAPQEFAAELIDGGPWCKFKRK